MNIKVNVKLRAAALCHGANFRHGCLSACGGLGRATPGHMTNVISGLSQLTMNIASLKSALHIRKTEIIQGPTKLTYSERLKKQFAFLGKE